MYHDFLGPQGLQGTHMDTLKPKNSKSMTFTVGESFFTFWAILANGGTPSVWFLATSLSNEKNTNHRDIAAPTLNHLLVIDLVRESIKTARPPMNCYQQSVRVHILFFEFLKQLRELVLHGKWHSDKLW